MRKELKNNLGARRFYTATFVRYGTKRGYRSDEPTILLSNIQYAGKTVCDHLWFNLGKGFQNLGILKYGDKICFEARAAVYQKGYKGYDFEKMIERPIEKDYRLSNPTNIRLVKKLNRKKFPKDLKPWQLCQIIRNLDS